MTDSNEQANLSPTSQDVPVPAGPSVNSSGNTPQQVFGPAGQIVGFDGAVEYGAGTGIPGFEPVATSNVPLGLGLGMVFGLVGAGFYAMVATLSGREFGIFSLLIGYGVGVGIVQFGKRKTVGLGFVAAVISALSFAVAVLMTSGALFAKEFGFPVMETMRMVFEMPIESLRFYFEDAMSWLFLAFAVVPAFFKASGVRENN